MIGIEAWLAASPVALISVCAALGLLIGSFLNVVILRLPARLQREWEEQSREILQLDHGHQGRSAGPAPADSIADPLDVVPAVGAMHSELSTSQAADIVQREDEHSVADVSAMSSRPATARRERNEPPDIVFSRSRCPRCAHALAAWENIPLLSYALLRGRCRACRAPISWQYPLVEALTGVAFALCAWRLGFAPELLIALVASAALVALSGIDLRTQLLPDQITLPLLWFALLVSAGGWSITPTQAIVGAAVGYLSLWSVYWIFKLLTGKEGMGYGDFKLLAALGALVGAAGILPIVLIASLLGAVIGSIQLAMQGRDRATPIPFGPYLAVAGWLQLLFGENMASAWNAGFGIG